MGETQSFLAKGSIQSFKSGKSAVFFSWGVRGGGGQREVQ